MGDASRSEPVGVTVADVLTVVVGVAAGFAVRAEVTRVVQTCGYYATVAEYRSVFWTLVRFALPAALGVVLAVLGRRVRYGGPPGAGEWAAVATFLVLLDAAVPGLEHVGGPITTRAMEYVRTDDGVYVPTRYIGPTVLTDLDPSRPLALALGISCGMGLAAVLAAWAVDRASRGRMPGWLALVLAAGAGWACLRSAIRLNPVEVVHFRFSWVPFPVAPPPGWIRPGFDAFVEGRLALGRWPLAMVVAVPALAAARDLLRRRRGGRRWTEWAGLVLVGAVGAAWAVDEVGLRPVPGPAVRAAVFSAWLVAVLAPAWVVSGLAGKR